MFEAARFLYLYVESPLHAGSGRGLGAVDLPIQRERVTQYPLVQASGIKGALRSVCERKADPIGLEYVFGTTDHAGAVSPGDARLLLAWTTSVDALMRFRRDALAIGEELPWTVPNSPGKNDALVTMDPSVEAGGKVVLEEYAFTPDRSEAETITKIAEWIANNALPNGD